MTTEQLAALKEVAETARALIPGRWRRNFSTLHGHSVWAAHGSNGSMMVATMGHADAFDAANAAHAAAFDPTTCLELLEEVERLRADGDELSATIEACHAMLDVLDPEYEEGMTTLTPLDTRLKEFLWPEGRITDDMINGDD